MRRDPFPLCEGKPTVSARLAFRDDQHCASLAQRLHVTSLWHVGLSSLCIQGKVGFTKSCQDAPLLAVGRNGIRVRGFGGQIPPTEQMPSLHGQVEVEQAMSA